MTQSGERKTTKLPGTRQKSGCKVDVQPHGGSEVCGASTTFNHLPPETSIHTHIATLAERLLGLRTRVERLSRAVRTAK